MSQLIGWIAFGFAVTIGLLNFYCWFIQYPLYRLLSWNYRWNSGLPGVGSLCLLVAIACLWGVPGFWKLALGVAILHTGGLPWFAGIVTFYGLRGRPARDGNKTDQSAAPGG